MEGPALVGSTDACDEVFASRMAAAGLSPTTHIGIAVSGGPDSTALCVLAKRWILKKGGSPFSLMGFIVDHGLRDESASEAFIVQNRIASLGIRCEVLKCYWPLGIPVHGHLQEAARNARYELIHKACKRNNLNVLLTAHHLDDQVELFIIRLTRNSGLAGLAGIPFTSNLYRFMPEYAGDDVIQELLLVRPLLGLRKSKLYEVCKNHDQLWVTDPTNNNLVFLRNVIRNYLSKENFCFLKEELPSLIMLCGKLRTIFDKNRDFLLSEAVWIDKVFGYIIIDLGKLHDAKPSEQIVKRMVVAILQFVAQKEKPPRGDVVQTLATYMASNLLKGALTLAGCNIFKQPKSKLSQIIVCASSDSRSPSTAQPVNMVWSWNPSDCSKTFSSGLNEMDISVSQSCSMSSKLECDCDTRFLKLESSNQLISEARAVGMLSSRAFTALSELQGKLSFSSTSNLEIGKALKGNSKHSSIQAKLQGNVEVPCGHACYFMNRFWIAWGLRKEPEGMTCTVNNEQTCELLSKGHTCATSAMRLWIRYMEEKDWIFLSQFADQRKHIFDLLSNTHKNPSPLKISRINTTLQCSDFFRMNESQHNGHVRPCCCNIVEKKLQHIVAKLKRVPVPVRHGLPVFVTSQGSLMSIPSLGFSFCPNMWVFSRFCPKVPLGGGCASWL